MIRRIKNLLSLSFLVIASISYGQQDSDILLTINEEKISVAEFKRVYLKNLNLVQDDSQKDVEGYLDLFIDYKIKIQEAYNQKLDEKETYQREMKGYRRQLVKNHLTDIEVTDKLVKEAYDRINEEVKARHILVRINDESNAADTLKAFNKIIEARKKIIDGDSFTSVAKRYSDDPSAKQNGGELGWFKAFKMVYPFETTAYNTPVGEISKPFRTRFGYHIVQPTERRKSAGEVAASHIMIALKQKDTTVDPEKRINEIYALLRQGEPFKSLAIKYSEDKKSGKKGGTLNKFSKGQLSSTTFENKVFALNKEGDYTEPFKTDFGWHIAKLEKRYPIGSYDQMKYELESKVKRDARARIISERLTDRLFEKYNVTIPNDLVSFFNAIVTDAVNQEKWKFDATLDGLDKIALTLNDTIYSYMDVGEFLERSQVRSKKYASTSEFVENKIASFFETKTLQYHEEHLEEQDPDFAGIITEYKEGLLLFDLMESTIWNRAKTDSLGLLKYYNKNSKNYQWDKRIDATVINTSDKAVAEQARQMLNDGQTVDQVTAALNEGTQINIIVTRRTFSVNDPSLPKRLNIALGISDVLGEKDYEVYQIHDILPAGVKALDEVKGQVATDFQKEVEEIWVKQLRDNAKIDINTKVLKKLSKSLNVQ
ncbi:peptidylprolyl isomerase [Dokdonia sinensis]|uniref:Peptidylprolyl isomerase n=1 Tax=Dokdonia sinensis TaxID=2479847 RepID=A0A3M0G6I9_9FLAO|nr:peptidylprolyl isomerase [Dokdonia sinensis]RMB57383.1 peptidylprolyl isomerase [Dokdonia sinensis]